MFGFLPRSTAHTGQATLLPNKPILTYQGERIVIIVMLSLTGFAAAAVIVTQRPKIDHTVVNRHELTNQCHLWPGVRR